MGLLLSSKAGFNFLPLKQNSVHALLKALPSLTRVCNLVTWSNKNTFLCTPNTALWRWHSLNASIWENSSSFFCSACDVPSLRAELLLYLNQPTDTNISRSPQEIKIIYLFPSVYIQNSASKTSYNYIPHPSFLFHSDFSLGNCNPNTVIKERHSFPAGYLQP